VFDTWRVHAATNFSDVDRIHLIIDLEPRGKLFRLMFGDVEPEALRSCLGHEYPMAYVTDLPTMHWLTAGKIETEKALWQADLVERNPQLGRYTHPEEF